MKGRPGASGRKTEEGVGRLGPDGRGAKGRKEEKRRKGAEASMQGLVLNWDVHRIAEKESRHDQRLSKTRFVLSEIEGGRGMERCPHGSAEWEEVVRGKWRKVCRVCGMEVEKPKKRCKNCEKWGASSKFSGDLCGTCKKKRKIEVETRERNWREGPIESVLVLHDVWDVDHARVEIRVPWKTFECRVQTASATNGVARLRFEYDVFHDIFEGREDRKPCSVVTAQVVARFSTRVFACQLAFVSGTPTSRKAIKQLEPNIHSVEDLRKLEGLWTNLSETDRHEALSALTLTHPRVRHLLVKSHLWPIVCRIPCAKHVLEFLGCDFHTPNCTGLHLLADITAKAARTHPPVGVQVLVGIGRSKAAKLAKHGITDVTHLANLDLDHNLDLAKAVTGNRNATQAARTLSGWRDAAKKYLIGRQLRPI